MEKLPGETPEGYARRLQEEIDKVKRSIRTKSEEDAEKEVERKLQERKAKENAKLEKKLRKKQEKERKRGEKEKRPPPPQIEHYTEPEKITKAIAWSLALATVLIILGIVGLFVNGFVEKVTPEGEHWYIYIFTEFGILEGALILIIIFAFLLYFVAIVLKILRWFYKKFYHRIQKVLVRHTQIRIPANSAEEIQLIESQTIDKS